MDRWQYGNQVWRDLDCIVFKNSSDAHQDSSKKKVSMLKPFVAATSRFSEVSCSHNIQLKIIIIYGKIL